METRRGDYTDVCFVSVQSLETWKQQQPQRRAGCISAVAWHVTEGLCKRARRIHLSHADTHILTRSPWTPRRWITRLFSLALDEETPYAATATAVGAGGPPSPLWTWLHPTVLAKGCMKHTALFTQPSGVWVEWQKAWGKRQSKKSFILYM